MGHLIDFLFHGRVVGLQVILVKGWNSRSWGFPKGKINRDERPVDCAVREVLSLKKERRGEVCKGSPSHSLLLSLMTDIGGDWIRCGHQRQPVCRPVLGGDYPRAAHSIVHRGRSPRRLSLSDENSKGNQSRQHYSLRSIGLLVRVMV